MEPLNIKQLLIRRGSPCFGRNPELRKARTLSKAAFCSKRIRAAFSRLWAMRKGRSHNFHLPLTKGRQDLPEELAGAAE
jgi:hypothetical protein